jgi:heme-degrading monooxygenase HmoA
MTVCRIWRGWTRPADAEAYQELVWRTVIPEMIEARAIPGFEQIDLMRRDLGDEVEFATIMWFDSVEAIKAFVGEDHEASHVPAAARAVLSRFDERAAHYEVLDRRPQPGR